MKLALLGCLGAVAIGSAASARTVVYPIAPAVLSTSAEQFGLMPSADPVRGEKDIALTIAPQVDHEVIRGGQLCSAYKVDNPISQIIRAMAQAIDRDGTLGGSEATSIALVVDRSSTLSRCVFTGEMTGTCITRVSIDAKVTAPGASTRPLHIEVERPAKVGGVCQGMAGAIGLISREAVIALLAQAMQ